MDDSSMNIEATTGGQAASERAGGTVNLASFHTRGYSFGRSVIVRALWFFVGLPLLRCSLNPFSGFKRVLLRVFGAKVGHAVIIKPGVRVKNPWLLRIGLNCWIGEDCWIDNLVPVTLGDNVCISQGAYLCTGNHDWTDPAFGYRLAPIVLEEGSWVGARAFVGPGVTLGRSAILP